MGDPKKPRKKWIGPKHPWIKDVLIEEMELVGRYGLRNKRELWIARTMIRKFRHQARSLLGLEETERKIMEKTLLNKLYNLGLIHENATLDDVLGLTVESLLKRRLQTLVYEKGLARTIYEARQLIVHGHIAIRGRRVTSPGYIVRRDEEDHIDFAPNSPLKEKVKVVEEVA